MNFLEALLLGVVQGVTEFLPISSSGHLVITEALLGVTEGGLLVEVTLHAGTLCAVLIYFRSRIYWLLSRGMGSGDDGERARRYLLWLLIGTLPAALVGLLFEEGVARVFESPRVALIGLLVTGVILFTSRWAPERGRRADGMPGLWMGLAQALAILPGVSRSGSTIAAGMWSGVDKSEAAEFSFLLSVPAIGGATLLHAIDLLEGSSAGAEGLALGLVTGFVVALISGYAAIAGLLEVLKRRGLVPFAWYCWAVGLAGLLLVSG